MLQAKDFKNAKKVKAKDFKEALDLCASIREKDKDGKYIIEISPSINKGEFIFKYSNFMIKGDDTVITGDKYGNELDENKVKNTTWKTETLKIYGSNNLFVNLKIENTAFDPANKGTSVALGIFGDNNTFINCSIDSTQDTLFLGPLPDDLVSRYNGFIPEEERLIEGNLLNFFISDHILGSVDFIFGAGQGVFYKCDIESVEDNRMNVSYVTAPAHSLKDDFGFMFYKCNFTSKTIFTQRVYLGRPWRDYGKVSLISCKYGNHIKDEGFVDWSNTAFRYLTARFEEYPLKEGRWEYVNKNQIKGLEPYKKQMDELDSL